jgi:hypothetical protein
MKVKGEAKSIYSINSTNSQFLDEFGPNAHKFCTKWPRSLALLWQWKPTFLAISSERSLWRCCSSWLPILSKLTVWKICLSFPSTKQRIYNDVNILSEREILRKCGSGLIFIGLDLDALLKVHRWKKIHCLKIVSISWYKSDSFLSVFSLSVPSLFSP